MRPLAGNRCNNCERTARRCALTLSQALKRESNAGAMASKAKAAGRREEVIREADLGTFANDRIRWHSGVPPLHGSADGRKRIGSAHGILRSGSRMFHTKANGLRPAVDSRAPVTS